MKKSEVIRELYEETLKMENSNDCKEKHIHEVNCFELGLILDNWKESYEEEETNE